MLIIERQQRVLEILRERGSAQLEELGRALEVSVSTIRRDLEALEQRGLVRRTHGGAIFQGEKHAIPTSQAPSPALSERLGERVLAKEAIGRAAAAMVQPHMTLLLDGGSTVIFAARQITARPLQVVTNSLSIANLFANDEQVEVLLIGGSLYPRTEVTVGPIAIGCVSDLHADLMFFSLAGIQDDAAYNINLDMARVEQAMMQQATRCVMLMDSSKFGRKSLVRVCRLDQVDAIITDQDIDPSHVSQLGDRLVVAE